MGYSVILFLTVFERLPLTENCFLHFALSPPPEPWIYDHAF